MKKDSKLETTMRADESARSCPSEKLTLQNSRMKSVVKKLKFVNKNE